jgi:hypothetical protein
VLQPSVRAIAIQCTKRAVHAWTYSGIALWNAPPEALDSELEDMFAQLSVIYNARKPAEHDAAKAVAMRLCKSLKKIIER